jgi:branched-chain amino acid transport system permease protein
VRSLTRYITILLIVGILIGLLFYDKSFILAIFSQVLVFSIAAMGLNILTGLTGQVSIGNAAFMSIGAYASTIFVMKLGIPMPIAIILAGTMASIFGLIIGFPSLRMKGFYLAITTMAFGVVIEQLISVIPYLGAHDGIRNITKLSNNEFISYLYVFLVYTILIVVTKQIQESPIGFSWKMVRDGETSATCFGINTGKAKLSAFMFSAFYGGIAGALYAHTIGYIRAADFGLSRSLDLLAMIMIGGLGSLQGGLAGSIIIVGLRFFFSRGFGPWLSVIIGSLLIIFTLFFSRGITWGITINWHKRLQVPFISVMKYFRLRRTKMSGKMIDIKDSSIFYVEKGSGKAVVFVHGNTGSSRWWNLVMDLSDDKENSYRTIALDLPNFGRSKSIKSAEIDTYADYLVEFIDRLSLEKPVIVGHSLGAAVVMSLSARYPDLPSAIVLVDGPSPAGLVTPPEHYPVIELYKTSRELMKKSLAAIAPGLNNDKILNDLTDDAMLMAPFAFTEHPKALERFNYMGKLKSYQGKVLIMWGKKDIIITEKMVDETLKQYNRAELVVFDDIGHSVMVEDPVLFKKSLLNFLRSI